MARKSRKQIAVEEPVIEPVSSEVFSTAIYADEIRQRCSKTLSGFG